MADLAAEQFVRSTTFRRDGTPVGTALWIVADGDHLYVWTGSQTGKVKRVRNNPAVTIAPATRRGKPTGLPVRPGRPS